MTALAAAFDGSLSLDPEEQRDLAQRAIAGLRGSIAAVPVNRALLPMLLADLAQMLRQRCEWRPEPGTVDEAVYFQTRLGRRKKLRLKTT